MRRDRPSRARGDSERAGGLHCVQVSHHASVECRQVHDLVGRRCQVLEDGPGEPAQVGLLDDRPCDHRQGGAWDVPVAVLLPHQVVEDEHRQQAMGGGGCHPERLTRLGEAHARTLGDEEHQTQRAVHRRDGVGGARRRHRTEFGQTELHGRMLTS